MIEEIDHLQVEYEGQIVNIISDKQSKIIIPKDTAIKMAKSILRNCNYVTRKVNKVEKCPVCNHLWKNHSIETSNIEVPQESGSYKKYPHWAIYCNEEDCAHRTADLPFCFDSIAPELVDYNPKKGKGELQNETSQTNNIQKLY